MSKPRRSKTPPHAQPPQATQRSVAGHAPNATSIDQGPVAAWKRWGSKLWNTFLTLGSVLGFASALVVFLPNPTATPNEPSDSTNLLSTGIVVKNEGIIPLSNVDVGIGVCSARGVMEDGRPVELRGECKPTGELKSIALLDKWRHHGLTAGESYTISLYDLGSAMKIAKLTYADISVTIAYRPWYSPFYGRPKQVRLVGALDEGGRAEWQFRPLDDN